MGSGWSACSVSSIEVSLGEGRYNSGSGIERSHAELESKVHVEGVELNWRAYGVKVRRFMRKEGVYDLHTSACGPSVVFNCQSIKWISRAGLYKGVDKQQDFERVYRQDGCIWKQRPLWLRGGSQDKSGLLLMMLLFSR